MRKLERLERSEIKGLREKKRSVSKFSNPSVTWDDLTKRHSLRKYFFDHN
jgi:hypothetical protein